MIQYTIWKNKKSIHNTIHVLTTMLENTRAHLLLKSSIAIERPIKNEFFTNKFFLTIKISSIKPYFIQNQEPIGVGRPPLSST